MLRERGDVKPDGELRQVVLLAAGIRNFRHVTQGLSAAAITDLLTKALKLAGDTVAHRGGTIDSVVGDEMLLYFADSGDSCTQVIDAARDLREQFRQLNKQRQENGLRSYELCMGIHAGKALMLNVG